MAVLGAVELTFAVTEIADFGLEVTVLEVRADTEDLTRFVLVTLVPAGFNVVDFGTVGLLASDFTSPLSVDFLSPGFGEEIGVFGLAAVAVRRGVIFGAVVLVFGTGAALKAAADLLVVLVVCLVSNCFGLDIVPVAGFLAAAAAAAVVVRAVFVGEVGFDFTGAFDDVDVFVVEVFKAGADGFFVAVTAAAVAATAAAPAGINK